MSRSENRQPSGSIGSALYKALAAYIRQFLPEEPPAEEALSQNVPNAAFRRAEPYLCELSEASPAKAEKQKKTVKIRSVRVGAISADFRGQAAAAADAANVAPGLEEALRAQDESFSQMLLRKIDEAGLTDAACYKKAGVDRKLFSKIRGDVNYRPSKTTAISFAVALELPLEETAELLKKAGYALSHSNKFDIIIEFFIKAGVYDRFQINEALYAFDQPLLL